MTQGQKQDATDLSALLNLVLLIQAYLNLAHRQIACFVIHSQLDCEYWSSVGRKAIG